MKKASRRLNLTTETIRGLNADHLDGVFGGYTGTTPDTLLCHLTQKCPTQPQNTCKSCTC